MATVDELFRKLSFGELSNLSIGSDGRGEISAAGQPKVIVFLNDALADLYNRFILSEKTLTIELDSERHKYCLSSYFAESNCDTDPTIPRFIKDADCPFRDDLLKILGVKDEHGCDLPLNDQGNCESLMTSRINTLEVPFPVTGCLITVSYQAKHKLIEYGGRGQTYFVPTVLEPAITAYIGSRVFSSMSGQEHLTKSQELMALYEKTCALVAERDSVNNTVSTTTHKFEQRGFV